MYEVWTWRVRCIHVYSGVLRCISTKNIPRYQMAPSRVQIGGWDKQIVWPGMIITVTVDWTFVLWGWSLTFQLVKLPSCMFLTLRSKSLFFFNPVSRETVKGDPLSLYLSILYFFSHFFNLASGVWFGVSFVVRFGQVSAWAAEAWALQVWPAD